MKKHYKVVYFGRDIQTLYLLAAEKRFKLIAINYIEDFFLHTSYNPVNLLFKYIYLLRYKQKLRVLELIGIALWRYGKIFSTSMYSKYAEYLFFISKHKLPILNINHTTKTLHFIQNEQVDIAVANICPLLPPEIISAPKFGIINVHPAKLPQNRGSLPTLWSLKNKDRKSAVSYFVINKNVDEGDIVTRHVFPIDPSDDALTLEKKIDTIVKDTLIKSLLDYLEGKITPVSQNHKAATKTARYYEYMGIDWKYEKTQDIYNKILLYPYLRPLHFCYTLFNRKKLFIKKATILNDLSIVKNLRSGEFIIFNFHVLIKVKDGGMSIPLFKGIGIIESLLFLFIRRGIFETQLDIYKKVPHKSYSPSILHNFKFLR